MIEMKHIGLKSAATLFAALVVMSLAAASPARAELITLSYANANVATQGTGPYGQLNITFDSSCSTSTCNTFDVTATGLNGFVFGDHGIVALNLNSLAGNFTSIVSSSITLTQGNGNEDGFGSGTSAFTNFNLNDGAGFSTTGYPSFSFVFTTQNAVTLADLLTPNGIGVEAAAHMALGTNTACTGFVGNAVGNSASGTVTNSACTTNVPEPGSLGLLGTALACLGVIGYLHRKRA